MGNSKSFDVCISVGFFYNESATLQNYTLSLHDALPIYFATAIAAQPGLPECPSISPSHRTSHRTRSEEHTSELQSHVNLVCRLLLKKTKQSGGVLAREGSDPECKMCHWAQKHTIAHWSS